MKALLTSLILVTTFPALAQDWKSGAPQYKKIGRAIADEKSPFYYPLLLDRYTSGDSTLSLEEKRHLYYGYTFQSAYSPYGRSDYEDSLRSVAKKDSLLEDDYAAILTYSDRLLAYNPFDLRAINYELFAHEKLHNGDDFAKNLARMNIIVDAIMSSGNGKTKETAFYVINTSHEYDLINILGLEFGGKQSLIDHYDYLTLAKNEHGIEGLYFDVSPCLDHLEKMFKK
jgi:hypothetical protein